MAFSGSSLRQQGQALARQLMQQPVGEIVEIVQPVAQIGIGLALQLGARVVLHALDRRLGGEPAADRLAQPAQPAAVMRDHPERFEHLDDARPRPPSSRAIDQFVDRGAHRLDRGLQPAHFAVDVVGDELRVRRSRADAARRGRARALRRSARPSTKASGAARFPRPGRRSTAIRPRRSVSASSIAVVCSASISSSE